MQITIRIGEYTFENTTYLSPALNQATTPLHSKVHCFGKIRNQKVFKYSENFIKNKNPS